MILTALFQAKQGSEQELEAALRAMIPETAKEQGALEYRLHQSRTVAGNYLFYEKFSDQAALDVHFSTPYYKALIVKIGPLLAGEPVVNAFKYLDGIPERV